MRTALLLLLACNAPPSIEDLRQARGSKVDVYFNDPGSRLDNIWTPDVISLMVDMVDNAQVSIDFAVMGFSHDRVVSAFERAHDRGVSVRMVGDAGHLYASGYRRMYDRHIPIVNGNLTHIMHDKFMIVDDRFIFAGTANWTPTDLEHNSNNFVVLDSPHVAADFQAEFDQMFAGAFGHQKVEVDNGRSYAMGDTDVEVWFSPNEDAMGRILELVDAAEESVRFTIFAFTKDQVGSALIRRQEAFRELDAAEGIDWATTPLANRRGVAGLIDQSQLHSNGQYHEVFRLMGAGVDMRMDAIDSSRQPGDYQAGGGRLHSKTMVIDAHGENPVVITGSFNWSASATLSNDEYLLVFHGKRVAQAFDAYFESLWENGRELGGDRIGRDGLQQSDIVINEVMWYGFHEEDNNGYDEFIELRNLTDRDIDLDLWQIGNADDFVVGLPPGSVIQAGGLFTIVDHVLEPYVDGMPQDEGSAYVTGDMVVNAFNDDRQARLYLKDGTMELFLKDPGNTVMDVAGDGGPPMAGGPDGSFVRSMERRPNTVDGASPGAWKSCSNALGGVHVNERFQSSIIATPGESNSP